VVTKKQFLLLSRIWSMIVQSIASHNIAINVSVLQLACFTMLQEPEAGYELLMPQNAF
jgi:hypothetical protein